MAKGGSQLKQLKSRLSSSGVTDKRQQSKKSSKRKRANEPDAAAQRRNKLAAITAALNPFEEKITRPKHDVPGRKIKGTVGRPGAAKAGGLAQRKATLLPEYEARNRAGSFVDRRFGENDTNMTPEERMLERFTKERQRRSSKGSMFNLNDGEDEGLTHYGQSLSGLDDFQDIGLGMDDDAEQEGIDRRTVNRAHFGGFEEQGNDEDDDEPERKKSKAEVMQEVMAKSKLHKYERQQMRDADDELRQALDDELGDIRGLLAASQPSERKEEEEEAMRVAKQAKYGDASRTGPNAVPLGGKSKGKDGVTATAESDAAKAVGALGEASKSGGGDTYDAFVRELAFERRAQPQDRLKSEAELAAEEAERLRKAEAARLRRMRGESESGSDDEEQGGKRRRGMGKDKASKRAKRVAGGDDLDDDFELGGQSAGDAYGLGQGLEGVNADADEDEDESDEGDEEEDEDEDDEGDEDEDEDENEEDDFADMADLDGLAQPGEGVESDAEPAIDDGVETAAPASKKGKATDASSRRKGDGKKQPALPFTFACPTTHEDFVDILESNGVGSADVPTVVQRIRTLYHASLAEDNKHRLQAFLGVLLDHALHCAATAPTRSTAASKSEGFALVNALLPHIFSLSQAYPVAASQHFVSKLALMQRNLTRGLSRGALNPAARTWPGAPELTLLRIAGLIWPTSDRSHPVTTPLALLVAQYLAHARVRSLRDLAAGLYLCSLTCAHEAESKRLVPEAINFLHHAVLLLAPFSKTSRATTEADAEAFGIPTPDVGAPHARALGLSRTAAGAQLPAPSTPELAALLSLPHEPRGESEDVQAKVDLLSTVWTLQGEFAQLYTGSTAFVELFTPVRNALEAVHVSALPRALVERRDVLLNSLGRQLKFARQERRALRLQAHRAVPIATFVPKFDQQGFNPDRRFDPDSERAQQQKLQALIKKERKGAIRELRKDNRFLAEARQNKQAEEDATYKKKMDKIIAGLQDERSEQKKHDKLKANLKRKAGKK